MKIAAIADVHSNVEALRAVLADLSGVDAVICAGDAVGYYAAPNEVCDLLRNTVGAMVRGNHDAYVTDQLIPRYDRRSAYRTDWTRRVLTTRNRTWLASLPVEVVLDLGGKHIKLRHANPWDEETYLYPDSQHLQGIRLGTHEVLIVGHTHWPMVMRCGEGIVLNPGSVGQPRDWNPMASYAILDTKNLEVEFRRAYYDVNELQGRLIRRGWDPHMISILSRTKDGENPRPRQMGQKKDNVCQEGICN